MRKEGKRESKSSLLITNMDLFSVFTGSGWVNFICGLCFGFVTKTVGNTLVFGYCWVSLAECEGFQNPPGE